MSIQPAQSPAVPRWTLGWRLQRALAHGHVSVAAMAADLEISRATASRWMSDKGADPRTPYLRRWALRTGVAYEWLCHGDLSPCDTGPTAAVAAPGYGRSAPSEINMHLYLSRTDYEAVA